MKVLDHFKKLITENAQSVYIATNYDLKQCTPQTQDEEFELCCKFENIIEKIQDLNTSHKYNLKAEKQQILEDYIIKQLKENPDLMRMICYSKTTTNGYDRLKDFMLVDVLANAKFERVLKYMINNPVASKAYDHDGNNLAMKLLKKNRPELARENLATRALDTKHVNNEGLNLGMFALKDLSRAIKEDKLTAEYIGLISDSLKDEDMSLYQEPSKDRNLGMLLYESSRSAYYSKYSDALLSLFDEALKNEKANRQENKDGKNMYDMAIYGNYLHHRNLITSDTYTAIQNERKARELSTYEKSLKD